eukprot:jgi/Psemu1/31687/gm1.31687_g
MEQCKSINKTCIRTSSSSYSSQHSISKNRNLYKSEFDLTAGPKQREKPAKDLMEEMRAISMSTDITDVRDVNKILGWAIIHLRLKQNKILGWAIIHLRLKQIQMIISIEEEESENGLQLRKEIGFLSSMRFIQKKPSNHKYYSWISAMTVFSGHQIEEDPDVTANAKDDILKNDELLEVFLDCSKGNVYLGKLSEKKKIG